MLSCSGYSGSKVSSWTDIIMKILLINPPYSNEERYGKLAQFGPCNEPLGLAYLAGALERAGHEVEILDMMLPGKYCSLKLPELIGVTMLTPMYESSKRIIQTIKKDRPDIPIVVGGPHPTILPSETLKDIPEIDYVIVGEGERTIEALCYSLENKIYKRYITRIFTNPNIGDLDDLPLPARHLLPMHLYKMTRSRRQQGHAYTVIVARGCPFACAFCCRIHGRKVRYHSVERVIEEINILVEKYDAKEINLEADTITNSWAFITDLCNGLISSDLSGRIKWTCESRIDTVNEEMLAHMKSAGCWQISYGVESGSQRLLDFIKKGIKLQQVEETFKLTKKVGISIRAFYILGIPTETREESLRTINFAKKLNADWSQFTLATPFPGTELYDWCIANNEPISNNWAHFKTHGGWTKGPLCYVPRGRTINEMKTLQKLAYRKVYMRPKVIWRFLKGIGSWGQFKEYLMGFWLLIKGYIS